jgi:putative addiction module component (TIGR02574 family)
MKLPADEHVRVAEKLLESADAEGFEDDSEAAIQAAWADEMQRRSRELADGSVRGLTVEEARRMVASDPADDDH